MAKKWEQIVSEIGRVPLSQTQKDKKEMLEEMGMTWAEFTKTEDWLKMAKRGMDQRFTTPGFLLKK